MGVDGNITIPVPGIYEKNFVFKKPFSAVSRVETFTIRITTGRSHVKHAILHGGSQYFRAALYARL